MRREVHAARRDQEGKVLQVAVVVGHQQVEHQPPEQQHWRRQLVLTGLRQLAQHLHAGAVLEHSRLVEQLARVDDVDPPHGRRRRCRFGCEVRTVKLAVEPLDGIDRLRHVQHLHRWCRQLRGNGQLHREPLQVGRRRVGVARRMVGLEDMGRGRGAHRLVQVQPLENRQHLVLGACQGHPLRGLPRERRARQTQYSPAQILVPQGFEFGPGMRRRARRQQCERACRLRAQVLQQRKRVVMVAQVSVRRNEVAQLLLGQQVVEVPLDRTQRRAVAMHQLAAGQSRRQVEAVRPVRPLRQVHQRPQVVVLMQSAKLYLVDEDVKPPASVGQHRRLDRPLGFEVRHLRPPSKLPRGARAPCRAPAERPRRQSAAAPG